MGENRYETCIQVATSNFFFEHLRLSGKGGSPGFPHSPDVCMSCSLICPKGRVMSLPSLLGKEPWVCVFVVMFLMGC